MMTDEELYFATASLRSNERNELGIFTAPELSKILHKSGRKISTTTIFRKAAEDKNFPVIKSKESNSKKPRMFFRVTDVEAYLDRHVNALKEHFGQ